MAERSGESLVAALRASMPERPLGECVSAETLHAAALGQLDAGALEAVARHVQTCEACAEDLRVSAALVAAADGQRGLRARPRVLRHVLALAGAGALAAGVFFAVHRAPPERGQDIRASSAGAPDGSSPRSVSATVQPASGGILEWTAVPGAVRYEVRISTESLQLIQQATLEGRTVYPLPPLVIESGLAEPLLWRVEAVLPGGQRVSSLTFHLQIRPGAAPPSQSP